MTWKRLPGGYMRGDGEFYIERGARMSSGGTNAWMIYRRVTEDLVGRDAPTAYSKRDGAALWAVDAEGWTETVDATDTSRPLYAHNWDAGSFAEARYVVEVVDEA